ncbi:MAG: arginine--tRNA ligase [bacterium]|nr:arginine--tRNA ligase [bacterium]
MKETIVDLIAEFFAGTHPAVGLPSRIPMSVPKDTTHGDLSSNICMMTAKAAGLPPRDLASELAAWLNGRLEGKATAEIAGPGFLNFRLAQEQVQGILRRILDAGREFGKSDHGAGKTINLEFVSANPTGPPVVVSARAAAFGSALARLLQCAGYSVTSEYYLNDAGAQVRALGGSLRARVRELAGDPLELPENGYHGLYLVDMARTLVAEAAESITAWDALPEEEALVGYAQWAVQMIQVQIKREMERFRAPFDVWFSEKELHASGKVLAVLELFEAKGLIYEADGARWFRSSDFGDEKDRVVIRSDGRPTYFLADAAYHLDKLERGFTKAINVLGPDHHGHIARMQAIATAIGAPAGWLEILLLQWVTLVENGEAVAMSKRAGEFVTMADLVEDVGVDVARTYFLTRRRDSHLEFDLTLAREQSSKSRVFYAQYATARIAGVTRKAVEAGLSIEFGPDLDLSRLDGPEELALIKFLEQFPAAIISAADAREPNRLFNYLVDTATCFHKFYHECQVVTEDVGLSQARLALTRATAQVLANGLDHLGVEAPERM